MHAKHEPILYNLLLSFLSFADLDDFTRQWIGTSVVNQLWRSCLFGRSQEHTCTCDYCQVHLINSFSAVAARSSVYTLEDSHQIWTVL